MLSALVVKKRLEVRQQRACGAFETLQAAKSEKEENKVRRDEKKRDFGEKRTPLQKAPRARTRRLGFSASSPLEQESNALCDRGGRARAGRQRNGATLQRERSRLLLRYAAGGPCRSLSVASFVFFRFSLNLSFSPLERLTAMLATLSANEERMAGSLKLPKGGGRGRKGGGEPKRGGGA